MNNEHLAAKLIQYKNELLIGALLLFALGSSLFVSYRENQLFHQWEIRRGKEAKLQEMIDLSIQYPDYRDLLYRLGIAQWELGNDQAAQDAIARAIYLDPNNPSAGSLRNF